MNDIKINKNKKIYFLYILSIIYLSACSISVTSNLNSDITDDTIVNYSAHNKKMQTEKENDKDLLKKILDKKSSVVSYTLCMSKR